MKKLIFTLLFAVTVSAASAQQAAFGIDLLKSKREAGKILKENGIEHFGIDVYKGEFLGERVSIVFKNVRKNQIGHLYISFDPIGRWNELSRTFDEIKALYDEKFGVGEVMEQIMTPYTKGDGFEMRALREGKYKLKAHWETEDMLVILHVGRDGGMILLYSSKQFLKSTDEKTERNLQDI